MKNNLAFSILFVSIIAAFIINGLFVSNTNIFLSHATTSLEQSLQQNQQDLQSTINNQVQQTITDTINSINNNNSNNSDTNNPVNGQGQNTHLLSPFQEKASIIDDMPTQKIRVGDIDIAYKQFGQGDNPIVLITGAGATMDMWSPHLLSKLSASNNNTVIIFDNRGAG